jgi:hypothetical protein
MMDLPDDYPMKSAQDRLSVHTCARLSCLQVDCTDTFQVSCTSVRKIVSRATNRGRPSLSLLRSQASRRRHVSAVGGWPTTAFRSINRSTKGNSERSVRFQGQANTRRLHTVCHRRRQRRSRWFRKLSNAALSAPSSSFGGRERESSLGLAGGFSFLRNTIKIYIFIYTYGHSFLWINVCTSHLYEHIQKIKLA